MVELKMNASVLRSLGKLQNFSGLWFPPLKNDDNKNLFCCYRSDGNVGAEKSGIGILVLIMVKSV